MGMFEGIKRLFGAGSDAASSASTQVASSGSALSHPSDLKPWEDRSLSPHERFEAYKGLVHEKLAEIAVSFDRAGEANDTGTQKEIMNSPETKRWMEEGIFLKTASAKELCERFDRWIPELLGKNFLGAEAWKAQGIDVGEVPPIPEAITKSLLESDCPLHPGEKIKDTHLLVLLPKTVNGEPYTLLKLDELCATRKGSGDRLIYDGGEMWATAWKGELWAKDLLAQSEWVLIPKSDPDPDKVSADKHFRDKTISQQDAAHKKYPEYREVKTLELMTAVLLYDLTHKERLLAGYYLRCKEPSAFDGCICVGSFFDSGLKLSDDEFDEGNDRTGRALARTV